MQEIDAIKKFYQCAQNDDLSGCLECLKFISADTINKQDGDDYDMLIQAVMNEDGCMTEALLQDGRCDITHRENLCGMTALEIAIDYGFDSRIFQAFNNAPRAKYIYRQGELIPKDEIYARILADKLEADDGCAAMMDDRQTVDLLLKGKISREDFEEWLSPDGLDAAAQFALLMGDPEYGQKFARWPYLREFGELSDWNELITKHAQFITEAPAEAK